MPAFTSRHSPVSPAYTRLVSMVNFSDPAVQAREYCAYTFPAVLRTLRSPLNSPLPVAMIKLWHTVGGIYM